MMRNVEIKARVSDFEAIRSVAEGIADGPPMLIEQEDTFFECPNGRLKVRRLSSHVGELIYYERRNTAEPAESRYIRASGASSVRSASCTCPAKPVSISMRSKA